MKKITLVIIGILIFLVVKFHHVVNGITPPSFSCSNPVLRTVNPTSNTEEVKIKPKPIEPKTVLSIAPNPTRGLFTLYINDSENINADKNYQVTVYNIFGGVLFRKEIQNIKTEIDLSDKATGLYFVKVQNGEHVYTDKVVVE